MNKIISVDEVEISPRGRKPEINKTLIKTFKSLKPSQAIVLDETFGSVPLSKRSNTSAKIRKHWAMARNDKPAINYNHDGVPQVRVRDEIQVSSL